MKVFIPNLSSIKIILQQQKTIFSQPSFLQHSYICVIRKEFKAIDYR